MTNVLKISEAASLALHTMVLLAANPGKTMSNRDIAGLLKVSEAHLAKVLQRLGRAGLVISQRGPKGGFVLGRDSSEISLLAVYEAVEGPLETKSCLLGKPVCGGNCILGGLLHKVGAEVSDYFSQTRLSDLTFPLPSEECHAQA
ncbi:MAG: Rrf2 family transcriptional regulator [Pseudomonadota bacterium]